MSEPTTADRGRVCVCVGVVPQRHREGPALHRFAASFIPLASLPGSQQDSNNDKHPETRKTL